MAVVIDNFVDTMWMIMLVDTNGIDLHSIVHCFVCFRMHNNRLVSTSFGHVFLNCFVFIQNCMDLEIGKFNGFSNKRYGINLCHGHVSHNTCVLNGIDEGWEKGEAHWIKNNNQRMPGLPCRLLLLVQ